jgi:hypothetical protein
MLSSIYTKHGGQVRHFSTDVFANPNVLLAEVGPPGIHRYMRFRRLGKEPLLAFNLAFGTRFYGEVLDLSAAADAFERGARRYGLPLQGPNAQLPTYKNVEVRPRPFDPAKAQRQSAEFPDIHVPPQQREHQTAQVQTTQRQDPFARPFRV